MEKSSVLIVEDEDLQRRILERQLKWSGFDVASAANAEAARARVKERADPFDVVVLDMRLKDDKVTGAQLGSELLRRPTWRHRPPEFLINSAFSWNDYYEQALELGVAAYLKKDSADVHEVVRHVRVLALRRALSPETPGVVERIRRIAVISCNREEAISRFCADFICAELRESLGQSFLVLLTVDSGTVAFSDREGLVPASSAYSVLQALTFGETGHSSPFLFDVSKLRSLEALSSDEMDLLPTLSGSAFVPLAAERDVRLSVGILSTNDEKDSIKETQKLAELIGQFFKPAVLEGLLKVLAAFSEQEQRREEVARATAQFCLYVGQEQLATLDAAEDYGELSSQGPYLKKLRNLAEDLTHSGTLLGELVRKKRSRSSWDQEEASGVVKKAVSMHQLVDRSWRQAERMMRKEDRRVFSVDGDCTVLGSEEYLHLALTQVLQWLVQRVAETPVDTTPAIIVRCEEGEDGPRVVFSDRSRKLPSGLREHLFVPLSSGILNQPSDVDFKGPGLHLSLYLAKMLVELGNDGLLLDDSESMEGDVGHKLVVKFPPTRPSLAA